MKISAEVCEYAPGMSPNEIQEGLDAMAEKFREVGETDVAVAGRWPGPVLFAAILLIEQRKLLWADDLSPLFNAVAVE